MEDGEERAKVEIWSEGRQVKNKYEIIEIESVDLTIDVSLISSGELFFNATVIAKSFNKRTSDFWKQEQNAQYLLALITLSGGNKDSFINTRRGKYGGTYLHRDLALQFARWCDPMFAVKMDKWIVERLSQERLWQRKRLAAKTGYIHLSEAIDEAHDPAKHYHYSTEANLLNRIILGMDAKEYKERNGVETVRDGLTVAELRLFEKFQRINTGLIEIGMEYHERKDQLQKFFDRQPELIC